MIDSLGEQFYFPVCLGLGATGLAVFCIGSGQYVATIAMIYVLNFLLSMFCMINLWLVKAKRHPFRHNPTIVVTYALYITATCSVAYFLCPDKVSSLGNTEQFVALDLIVTVLLGSSMWIVAKRWAKSPSERLKRFFYWCRGCYRAGAAMACVVLLLTVVALV